MSQTPYSQPPYQLDEDDIEPGESITIYAGGGAVPIGTVLNYDDFPCADNDEDLPKFHAEALATARLWVAAPELYEACQRADYLLSSLFPSKVEALPTELAAVENLARQLRAAIAKAEGVQDAQSAARSAL